MKNKILWIVIGVIIIFLVVQWGRFKKCLNQVYLNCATNPSCLSDCTSGAITTNPNNTTTVTVSKFPFSAKVLIGSQENK